MACDRPRRCLPHAAFNLEFVRNLDARVITEVEVFGAMDGIAFLRALCAEGIEGFEEEVLRRDVACTKGKAADTVEVTIRQCFRAIAAEEGAVFEVFVVCKGIPATDDICVALADIGTEYPEGRVRAAASIAAKFVARTTEITTCIGTVNAPIEGQGLCTHSILRTKAKDVGNVHFLVICRPVGQVCTCSVHACLMVAIAHRAEIPSCKAEVVAHFLAYLDERSSINRRYIVLFQLATNNLNRRSKGCDWHFSSIQGVKIDTY